MNDSSFENQSAVVVLLDETMTSLVLTQRSHDLRDHPGEICFPGGRWEGGDTDLWMTALRELREELGIDASRIQRIKKLKLEQTLRGSIIQPWFASIATIEPYVINYEEVASIVTVPLSDVQTISNYKDITVTNGGRTAKSCQFTGSSHGIWGATARIMKQLCEIFPPST